VRPSKGVLVSYRHHRKTSYVGRGRPGRGNREAAGMVLKRERLS